jgi:hypothetical protein
MLDRIVVLKNGLVVESGSYKELLDRDTSHFKSFLSAFNESMSGDYGNGEAAVPYEEADDNTDAAVEDSEDFSNLERRVSPSERMSRTPSVGNGTEAEGDLKENTKLMTDEMAEREIGKVGTEVYMTWAKAAGGVWVVLPLLLVFAAGECMTILSNWWLTYWSHAATPDSESQLHFLAIYGLINVIAIFADFSRMLTILLLGLRASNSVRWKETLCIRTQLTASDLTCTTRFLPTPVVRRVAQFNARCTYVILRYYTCRSHHESLQQR